ncbi:MAG TPA: hypothetical protein VGO92_13930 [Acidimicrobiales bacterium]|jgi:hypothetical protein|nr:hypothetical protein [Acidimicrobiales bacterium]
MALVVVCLTMLQVAGPPAAHAAGNQGIVGTGTISPGIPTNGSTVSSAYTFNGTAAGLFGSVAGTCTINFNGSGTDSTAMGSGAGNFSCNGSGITVSCNASYSRVGMTLTLSGNCSGTVSGLAQWLCQTIWTSVPATSFGMICDTLNI